MKKIIKHTNYYTFDNVDEFLNKVDIDKLRNELDDYPIDYSLEEISIYFKDILKYFGFTDVETYFDVSYCQGSGASFTGVWCIEDMDIYLKNIISDDKELKEAYNLLNLLIDDSMMDCDCFDFDNIEKECKELYENYNDKKDCQNNLKLYSAIIKRIDSRYFHKYTVEAKCYDYEYNERDDLELNFNNIIYILEDWFYDKLCLEFNNIMSDKSIAYYYVYNKIELNEEFIKKDK